ncbi:MAG: RidA family protein [Bacillota bacterium]|nr:RidA family protein [Bacillota bacterium]
MGKVSVQCSQAPAAIGPYSQAIRAGSFVFLSGQLPLDPATGQVVGTTAAEQAQQALRNLSAILLSQGMSMDNVVKTTVFLQDLGDFAAVNEVYAGFVGSVPPARSAVAVKALPKGALVEIEAIAAESQS